MFGWAAGEVVKIVILCDKLIKAYSDGPRGAKAHFEHVQSQVQSCKKILSSVKDELVDQDTRVYIGLSDIKNTLVRCQDLFEGATAVYKKEDHERTVLQRVAGAVVYVWEGATELNQLSTRLGSHIYTMGVYLQVLQMQGKSPESLTSDTN